MKNRKRMLALLLSLVLIASLCACNNAETPDGTASPSADASQDPGAVSTPEVDLTQDAVAFSSGLSRNDVLLTVNGEDVPADLFLYWLFGNCYTFEMNYYFYGLTVENFADLLLEDTVNMAVFYTVLRQRATELGCLPTDDQAQEAMDELLAEGESLKATYGFSEESINYLNTIYYYYENLMDTLVPTATEEMLNNFVYQTKHILLSTVDQTTGVALDEETVAAQRALAEDILARLQAVEGEERLELFDELMNQYSEDGRDENGNLYAPDGYEAVLGAGATSNDLRMVEAYEEASLALPIGGMSGIVESNYGFHIILRGEVDDFEDYIERCRAYQLDLELEPLTESAKVTRGNGLDGIDVADFYERYIAYQIAVMEQYGAQAD